MTMTAREALSQEEWRLVELALSDAQSETARRWTHAQQAAVAKYLLALRDSLPHESVVNDTQRSQVDAIGAPRVKTWKDYRLGCKMTYGGGHEGEKLDAFQHGMDTVFNLLEAEFPSAEVCKSAQSETQRSPDAWRYRYGKDGGWKYTEYKSDINPGKEYESQPLYAPSPSGVEEGQ